jgi:hypothetical protein
LADYLTLAKFSGVRIKMPTLSGPHIFFTKEIKTEKGVIPEHYTLGQLLPPVKKGGNTEIVFRHYYGFAETDFGFTNSNGRIKHAYRTARVEIIEKEIAGGKKFLLINIHKDEGRYDKQVKFFPRPRVEDHIMAEFNIHRTEHKIAVVKL